MLELINRLLAFEKIDGDGCSPYLHRWTLLSLPGGRKVYLHRYVGSDWTRNLHDHPKHFVSIGLRGGYVEQTPQGLTQWRAPWIRRFPPHHIHRLRVCRGRGCLTLVYVGPWKREWGFWVSGRWWRWDRYVKKFGDCA